MSSSQPHVDETSGRELSRHRSMATLDSLAQMHRWIFGKFFATRESDEHRFETPTMVMCGCMSVHAAVKLVAYFITFEGIINIWGYFIVAMGSDAQHHSKFVRLLATWFMGFGPESGKSTFKHLSWYRDVCLWVSVSSP
jgi:hypothetical protein